MLNDNERRAPEWRRLLGEFFAPRFGGTPRAWGDANWTIFSEILGDWSRAQRSGTPLAPDWFAQQDERWLTGMFERVGVPVPTDLSGTIRASKAHVMDHIDCAYPEAGPAVRAMHQRGITLHMASSGVSSELAPYLSRMGILDLFDRLYGPDLIGTHKTSPRFYERIAEDSGVDPDTAIVVATTRSRSSGPTRPDFAPFTSIAPGRDRGSSGSHRWISCCRCLMVFGASPGRRPLDGAAMRRSRKQRPR